MFSGPLFLVGESYLKLAHSFELVGKRRNVTGVAFDSHEHLSGFKLLLLYQAVKQST